MSVGAGVRIPAALADQGAQLNTLCPTSLHPAASPSASNIRPKTEAIVETILCNALIALFAIFETKRSGHATGTLICVDRSYTQEPEHP
jgi:hypothetical protein